MKPKKIKKVRNKKKILFWLISIPIIFFLVISAIMVMAAISYEQHRDKLAGSGNMLLIWIFVYSLLIYGFFKKEIHRKIANSQLGQWVANTKIGGWWLNSLLSKSGRRKRIEKMKEKRKKEASLFSQKFKRKRK